MTSFGMLPADCQIHIWRVLVAGTYIPATNRPISLTPAETVQVEITAPGEVVEPGTEEEQIYLPHVVR